MKLNEKLNKYDEIPSTFKCIVSISLLQEI